jgi:small subunit ribosomal protein S8
MLTRVRNATRIESPAVEMPCSNLKVQIARVLKEEGFVLDYQVGKYVADEAGNETFDQNVQPGEAKQVLRIFLKYGPEGERVIRKIDRTSKPGCRIYRSYTDLRPVLDGLGIAVLSTSKGVMSDRQARTQRVGGEVICTVW